MLKSVTKVKTCVKRKEGEENKVGWAGGAPGGAPLGFDVSKGAGFDS